MKDNREEIRDKRWGDRAHADETNEMLAMLAGYRLEVTG